MTTRLLPGRAPFPVDPWILAVVLLLAGLGLSMVYSASSFIGERRFGSHLYFVQRQSVTAVLGLVVMSLLARLDAARLVERLSRPLLVFVLVALVAVLVPPFGHAVGGARRWLTLGGVGFQPSELAKPVLVLYMACLLSRRHKSMESFREIVLAPMTVLGAVTVLLLLEPDLGTALLLGLVTLAMMFLAGVPLRFLIPLGLGALPVVGVLIYTEWYRLRRVLVFLDPWEDPLGSGFQIIQSFLALGSGGLTGLGAGAGRQKLFFLPEPHTDFIFSVIGEEFGFLGCLAVMGLFAILAWRGVRLASRARDRASALVAAGATAMLCLQAWVHMAVAVSLVPTKGIPLPFLSYGGSSLMASFLGAGLLLSVSASQRRAELEESTTFTTVVSSWQ